MIEATMDEVRSAFGALSRMFEETKLGPDATWRVSRVIGALKGHVKDFARSEAKLYKDAGGVVGSGRAALPNCPGQQPDEKLEDYEKRFAVYRERVNALSDSLDAELERKVKIEVKPVELSLLPKTRKNDKGDSEDVQYRATDLSECGPFLVEKAAE